MEASLFVFLAQVRISRPVSRCSADPEWPGLGFAELEAAHQPVAGLLGVFAGADEGDDLVWLSTADEAFQDMGAGAARSRSYWLRLVTTFF